MMVHIIRYHEFLTASFVRVCTILRNDTVVEHLLRLCTNNPWKEGIYTTYDRLLVKPILLISPVNAAIRDRFYLTLGFTVALMVFWMAKAIARTVKAIRNTPIAAEKSSLHPLGYTLSALSKPMMGLLIAPVWIFMARAFDRIGKGLRTVPGMLCSPARRRRKLKPAFGFHRAWIHSEQPSTSTGTAVSFVFPGQYRGCSSWPLFPVIRCRN